MDPIEEKHRAVMKQVADFLRQFFPGRGFALLVFDFGEGGRMNYVSNAQRQHMVSALREMIARMEARAHDAPKGPVA